MQDGKEETMGDQNVRCRGSCHGNGNACRMDGGQVDYLDSCGTDSATYISFTSGIGSSA